MESIRSDDDLRGVEAALRGIYVPCAMEAAHHLQKVVTADGYPAGSHEKLSPPKLEAGTCWLFLDGLRIDLGKRLEDRLEAKGLQIVTAVGWTALPSVTATAKPAVTPVSHLIVGQDANEDFTPVVAESEKSLKGSYELQKLLEREGWQRLAKSETGDPAGRGWSELGDIDKEGHELGWKLARHLDGLLSEAVERVEQLLAAGWSEIRIVTDHGWLLMPGGLPKTELPASLAVNKRGRFAAIKPGVSTDQRLYHWFWNPTQCFVFADGIRCFQAKKQYDHGGLSLQECLTMSLTVARSGFRTGSVRIT